jgi:hypothetical protein
MKKSIVCNKRVRVAVLVVLAVTQILFFMLIISQPFSENSKFIFTRQRRPRADGDDCEVVSVKDDVSSVYRDIIVDLLMAVDNDELNDDKVSLQKDFQLLAELINNLHDSVRKNTTNRQSVAAATNGTENDAGRRLELLERFVELAKYKLKEISRRKKMEPVIAALTEIVERMKQENKPGFLRQKLSTVRLNFAEQTSDE